MSRPLHTALFPSLLVGLLAPVSVAQASRSSLTTDFSSSAQRGIALAQGGHCPEALALLKKATPQLADKELKLKAALATVRCAMKLDQRDTAVDALKQLNHEFPHDPDVLYVSTHAYSDLATRVSGELAQTAPNSYQARELQAEALEVQGKWDEAAKQYRAVLKQNPSLPGIHYRLARILLSKPGFDPGISDEAKRELQQELAIDPNNAGAEYVLGALARQNQQWDEAIAHFSRATKLDAGFGDAFLELGTSLIFLKRFSEAIPTLETAVRLQPGNPGAHYNLAMAYSRSGRKDDAEKEFATHRQLLQQRGGAGEDPAQPNPN
jgi:tetratricopeptide (TPR) repeat protein